MKAFLLCVSIFLSGCSPLLSTSAATSSGVHVVARTASLVLPPFDGGAGLVCFTKKEIISVKTKIVDLKAARAVLKKTLEHIEKKHKVKLTAQTIICKTNVEKYKTLSEALHKQLVKRRFWYTIGIVSAFVTGAGAGVLVGFVLLK